MRVRKKRLRNIERILSLISNEEFYVTACVSHSQVKKIGFNTIIVDKEVLPRAVGPISLFNKEGKYVIKYPKEMERVVHIVPYNITDWHGNPHSGMCSKTYERLVKNYIDSPKEKIHIIKIDGDNCILSTRLISKEESHDLIKHIVNLMLELFDEIDFLNKEKEQIIPMKRVPWKIFPPGDMPWDNYYNTIKNRVKNYNNEQIKCIRDRYDFLQSLDPISIICGDGGLIGYFIAELDSGLHICDSIFIGNAVYILDENWETVSKLTKKQIIDGNLSKKRIVHNGDWQDKIKNEIKKLKNNRQ